MIHFLWLSGVAALLILMRMYGHHGPRADDLGTVSAQWLHEHRRETHQSG